MKQAFYDVHYVKPDGHGLIVGPFCTREEAENWPKDGQGQDATFLRIDRFTVEVTQEQLLRATCVICGDQIGFYESSWRAADVSIDIGRRACRTHPCPPGFRYYTDG